MKAPLQEDVDSKKEAERAVCNCAVRRPDIHGLDIDGEFRNPKSSRPKNWEVSLKAANEILIDEMRTLLELHYDDINSAKQAQRSPKDKKGSVLACAAFAHKKKLNQKLVLPARVKEILRRPQDEVNLGKLEELCVAVRQEIEAETLVHLPSTAEIEALAQAVETCQSKFGDEVGPGSKIPEGARVVVAAEEDCPRAHVAKLIRSMQEGHAVRVKMRPLKTCRAPPLDPSARDIMRQPYATVREMAMESSVEDVRDRLLLALWDALFLSQAQRWTEDEVANTSAAQALELGFWFGKGQAFAKKPLIDGICGTLSYIVHLHRRHAINRVM